MILWFVLRFGIYFLRAGNVSDGPFPCDGDLVKPVLPWSKGFVCLRQGANHTALPNLFFRIFHGF